MASIVNLAEVKEHLRITHSFEDTIIGVYILAADDWVSNYLNQTQVPVRNAIKAAALLIVGDMYEHKEAHQPETLSENPAINSLLYPYRVGIGI